MRRCRNDSGRAFRHGCSAFTFFPAVEKFSVFLIDAGYQLVYLAVMGAILGAWH
jgi:hypothetical protein